LIVIVPPFATLNIYILSFKYKLTKHFISIFKAFFPVNKNPSKSTGLGFPRRYYTK
jgi:hypothetical protein